MPRVSFGGAGDYSQLFAALVQNNIAEMENLADAAERRNKKVQAAADDDMFDRYKAGEISDDEILEYIQQRVTETAGEPDENVEWKKALREYQTAIADGKAEEAYSAGGSINEIIGHYEGRLDGVESNTPLYRELVTRLNQLKDERSSKDIRTGAEAIIDDIERGKASYRDLTRFYQDAKKQLRPGSPLVDELDKALDDAQDNYDQINLQAKFDKLEYRFTSGKMTGRNYGQQLKALARTYKESDPAKYWQIMTAAAKIIKANPGFYGRGGSGGGGGTGGGSRGGASSTERQRKTIDALQGSLAKQQAKIAEYEKNPSAMTPADVKSTDQAILKGADALARAYRAAGDKSAAANVLKSKATYITNHVQPHNSLPALDAVAEGVKTAEDLMNAAENEDDPVRARRYLTAAGQSLTFTLEQGQKALATEYTKTTRAGDNYRDTVKVTRPTEDAGTAESIAVIGAVLEAVRTGLNPNATDADIEKARDVISQTFANSPNAGGTMSINPKLSSIAKRVTDKDGIVDRHYGAARALDQLDAGEATLVKVPTGGTAIVPVIHSERDDFDPATGSYVKVQESRPAIDLEKGQQLVQVWQDVNGRPVKAWAVATTRPIPGSVFVATKKMKLGGITLAKGQPVPNNAFTSAEEIEAALRSGALQRQQMPGGYLEITVDGKRWSQDPETKLWYKGGLPIKGSAVDNLGFGTIQIDPKTNEPKIDWQPHAQVAGQPQPYLGTNREAMQREYDKGLVDTTGVGGRDELGRYTTDPKERWTMPYQYAVEPPRENPWTMYTQTAARQQKDMISAYQKQRQREQQAVMLNAKAGGQTRNIDSLTDLADSVGIRGIGTAPKATPKRAIASPSLRIGQAKKTSLNVPKIEMKPTRLSRGKEEDDRVTPTRKTRTRPRLTARGGKRATVRRAPSYTPPKPPVSRVNTNPVRL